VGDEDFDQQSPFFEPEQASHEILRGAIRREFEWLDHRVASAQPAPFVRPFRRFGPICHSVLEFLCQSALPYFAFAIVRL
jgi:hypothetical protein